MFQSVNPATGARVSDYSAHNEMQTRDIISQVHLAWMQWKDVPFSQRAVLMERTAEVLLDGKEEYARLMVLEMGKPIQQARAEVEKCASVCRYYASHAERFLAPEPIATENTESFIAYNPLGVVLAVMPWNFPFWQVFRFAAPALMGGNAGLLKHASNVMGCAMAIEEVFRKAGFPENVFRTLRIAGRDVAAVIENPLVKAVTLTGSVGAGVAVASKAGGQLKKTVLELGGSDPYLVLEDADLELAATACVASRMINGGQSCVAAKRFIVVDAVYDQFEAIFLEKMRQKMMGDPFDEHSDLGPQAQVNLRDELHQQVLDSISLGARCLLGGYIPDQPGAWYPPTVLAEVKPGMPAWQEELFGPVAALIRAGNETEAIRIANDSIFGLGAAVFTRNPDRGRYIAQHLLNAGSCFVNDFVKSDPRLPFGGIGHSGYGRELSYLGIREFMNVKTVVVK